MNFFIAIVFVVVGGTPQMAMSPLHYVSEADCMGSLRQAIARLEQTEKVDGYYAKCFQISPKSA